MMIKGVNYRIYAYIGAYKHVTAYRNLSFVEYCEIIVAYKIRAYGDICSKIAVETDCGCRRAPQSCR